VRNATSGDSAYPTQDSSYFFAGFDGLNNSGLGANIYLMSRAFFPSDTSSIPDGGTVDAAALKVKTSSPSGSMTAAVVVTTSQASSTTLATGDYDAIGSTSLSDEQTMTGTTTYTYTLTEAGRAEISKTGTTLLGIRNKAKDIDNTAPTTYDFVALYFSESAGTTNDPYYDITYTEVIPSTIYLKGRPRNRYDFTGVSQG